MIKSCDIQKDVNKTDKGVLNTLRFYVEDAKKKHIVADIDFERLECTLGAASTS